MKYVTGYPQSRPYSTIEHEVSFFSNNEHFTFTLADIIMDLLPLVLNLLHLSEDQGSVSV